MSAAQPDRAVDEFVERVGAVDGVLQWQARADAGYFVQTCDRHVGDDERASLEAAFVASYRWQYIHSGAQQPHFGKVLGRLITDAQSRRIQAALATLH